MVDIKASNKKEESLDQTVSSKIKINKEEEKKNPKRREKLEKKKNNKEKECDSN